MLENGYETNALRLEITLKITPNYLRPIKNETHLQLSVILN